MTTNPNQFKSQAPLPDMPFTREPLPSERPKPAKKAPASGRTSGTVNRGSVTAKAWAVKDAFPGGLRAVGKSLYMNAVNRPTEEPDDIKAMRKASLSPTTTKRVVGGEGAVVPDKPAKEGRYVKAKSHAEVGAVVQKFAKAFPAAHPLEIGEMARNELNTDLKRQHAEHAGYAEGDSRGHAEARMRLRGETQNARNAHSDSITAHIKGLEDETARHPAMQRAAGAANAAEAIAKGTVSSEREAETTPDAPVGKWENVRDMAANMAKENGVNVSKTKTPKERQPFSSSSRLAAARSIAFGHWQENALPKVELNTDEARANNRVFNSTVFRTSAAHKNPRGYMKKAMGISDPEAHITGHLTELRSIDEGSNEAPAARPASKPLSQMPEISPERSAAVDSFVKNPLSYHFSQGAGK